MTIKGDSEVRQKLKQVKFRHLKRELSERLQVAPRNCDHNKRLEFEGREVGFCSLRQTLCTEEHGPDLSQDCLDFSCRYNKDQIKEEFTTVMESPIHEIAAKYPDVAALTWVLSENPVTDFLPGSTLVGSIQGVLIWADSESEATIASQQISSLVDAGSLLKDSHEKIDVLEKQLEQLSSQVCTYDSYLGSIEQNLSEMRSLLSEVSVDLSRAASITKPEKPFWKRWFSWR